MDVHKNARLTFACRVLLVERIQGGRPKAQVARKRGVSDQTTRKWLRRYREQGVEGLRDRRSRLHRSPAATPEVLRIAVVALRRQRLTLVQIAMQLGLSRATVARIARAAGLKLLSKLEPAPVYRRYERAERGELLHPDVKKPGRIVKVGHRISGGRQSSHTGPAKGWEYLHVAIDDASRVAYAQLLPDREWAYARAYRRSHQRRDALPTWLHGYNWHRPHMSLAGQPPINRLGLSRNNVMRLHT